MRHVLITGAGGFIGSHTVRLFVERGEFVHALVHKHVPQELRDLVADKKISLHFCDIRDKSQLAALFQELPPLDAIVHSAARASDVGREKEFISTNYHALQHLVAEAKQNQTKRFVFVSTTDVYGMRDFHGETEQELSFDHSAANPYPKYKILAEKWIRKEMPPEQYSIVRPAAVWGEDDPTLTKRVKDFLAWSPCIVHFGPWKGKNRWPLAHVENVALANYLAAFHPHAQGQALQVLDPETTSMDDFYRQTAARYYPDKAYKTLCLPSWCGTLIGSLSTGLSNLLNTAQPVFDPTLYAVLSISHNLDFSSAFFEQLKGSQDLAAERAAPSQTLPQGD